MGSHQSNSIIRDPKHVEWVRAWLGLLEEVRKYVVDFHTTGLVWNANVCPNLIFITPN